MRQTQMAVAGRSSFHVRPPVKISKHGNHQIHPTIRRSGSQICQIHGHLRRIGLACSTHRSRRHPIFSQLFGELPHPLVLGVVVSILIQLEALCLIHLCSISSYDHTPLLSSTIMSNPRIFLPFFFALLFFLTISSHCIVAVKLIDAPLIKSKLQTNNTITVDSNGNGDFTSVQKAIDSIPDGNSHWIVIYLPANIYKEKILIPKTKPYIFLRGNGMGRTQIVWDESSAEDEPSATFTLLADNFVAFGISFMNESPSGEAETPLNRSVAAMVAGDKAAFYQCAFYSPHNTLFDRKGRHYYENCYIQGSIDFIFGRGQSIFQSFEIFVVSDERKKIHGSITAHNGSTPDGDGDGGFVFLDGRVYGVRDSYLGRPMGPYSTVIFARTYISNTIVPEGWTTYDYEDSTDNLMFGEFQCSGPGANPFRRVGWAKQLTEEEAKPFLTIDFIDGEEWLPVQSHI